jgi:phosphoenolpyruvate carboxykinase (ATP)
MPNLGIPGDYELSRHGLRNLNNVYWNLSTGSLIEQIIARKEAELSNHGAVLVNTGQHTGRSPNDKFIVQYGTADERDVCWSKINQPITPEKAARIHQKMCAYLQGRDVFVQDMLAGAHPAYHLPIRVVTEHAWHNLFARNLFIRLPQEKLKGHIPQFTVIQCPDFQADPELDGTNTGTFIILDLTKRYILIGGTSYAGEIKKSIFSVLNYLLPRQGILAMHCSANVADDGNTALFFGLSGTGKTTLSSDPERRLIGDDEHGWGNDGVFNFEGGCYAKTIKLKNELEPLIWQACHEFGTVLENVVYDPTSRALDFDSAKLTENTRAAYPLDFIPNHVPEGYAGHPNHIFFLSADAFGVLPPISLLTPEQAMYYFLSGYTSKLAGTEKGLGVEPQTTFSNCFGAPFLPLQPGIYAKLLGEKISNHHSKVWLINTGWTGGPYGIGQRIKLPYTRAMIKAALTDQLENVAFSKEPYFGLMIPTECPGVPKEVLDPQETWASKTAYQQQARSLISRFEKNFDQFAGAVLPQIIEAGPHSI